MPRTTLIIIAAGALIILVGGVLFFGRRAAQPQPAIISFWSIKDDAAVWEPVISRFQEENPHLTVNYTRLEETTYEDVLINRLAEGRGPDIFVLPNTLLVKHRDKILPLPKEFNLKAKDFQAVFADIASAELIGPQGEIWGAPLFVDTLALFYDRDVFNTAGIAAPPKNWDQVAETAKLLTKINPSREIEKSGMALGTYDNVDYAFEILSALMLQNGDPIISRDTGEVAVEQGAEKALDFYTSFAKASGQNFSWADYRKNSFTAFGEGDVAMVFGFAEDVARITARNPHLAFRALPFPQSPSAKTAITYGRYFFPAVSKFSPNPTAAWQFVLYATLGEGARIYNEQTGRPPARRDLIATGANSAILDVFYKQVLTAKSWPVPDETGARRLFQEAVNSVVTRTATPDQATRRLKDQLLLIAK